MFYSLSRTALLAVISALLLSACGSSPNNRQGGSTGPGDSLTVITDPSDGSKTYIISDDDNDTAAADDRGTYQDATLTAFFLARNGECIEFEEGTYRFTTSLVMSHKEGICIKGKGMDKTILDFTDSNGSDGFSLSHMKGITVEDLTIIDTPGFSIRVSDSDFVTLRNMRTMWSSFNGGMDIENPATLDVQCNGLSSTEQDIEVMAAAEPDRSIAPLASPVTSFGTFTDANGIQQQYATNISNGGYAIYPVLSNNVYLDNVVALGASDAGIYVGQSNDIVVENSLAMFNVAGYEIENSDRAVMRNNRAFCNTGGFLIFDLPGLNQYGDQTRAHHNVTRFNNWPNFAPPGGVVAGVPSGVGFLQLGYDKTEIFENHIYDNSTLGYVFVSLELMGEGLDDKRMDLYPEGVHLHHNTFRRNGLAPQLPEEGVITCGSTPQEITLPNGDTRVVCQDPTGVNDGHDSLLPALVSIKQVVYKAQNPLDTYLPLGADVIWDGFHDGGIYDCEVADQGLGDNQPTIDGKGKPQYDGSMSPACRTNSYKFEEMQAGDTALPEEQETTFDDGTGAKQYKRTHPRWWHCMHDNTYSEDFPTDLAPIRPYMNFVDTDPANPPLVDKSVHDCEAIYGPDVYTKFTDEDPDEGGKRMPPLEEFTVAEFVPGENGSPVLSDEEVLAICENFSGNNINRAALEQNCPKLSHFNLFANKAEPRSGFNEQGYLFDLSTPLFSDYASKYRVLWTPPNQPAEWREGNASASVQTLYFPPGTVIAKTFTFKDESNSSEEIVETRLIIHRSREDGASFWEGMAYVWQKDENGNYVDANISLAGQSAPASWNYQDPHPDVDTVYSGSTDRYAVPNPNQCGECHQNDDLEPGDAPIGPKVRLLNIAKANGVNQLQEMIDAGILTAPPVPLTIQNGIATNAQRLPNFIAPIASGANDAEIINIPGSSADNGGEGRWGEDTLEYRKEMRARAYLETNCAHCHNRKGIAKQTGFWLDAYRRVDQAMGICKTTTTAASASDGRTYDIHPGNSSNSIAHYRIGTNVAGQQMPPVARSVNHAEGIAIVEDWIDNVLDGSYPDGGCAE